MTIGLSQVAPPGGASGGGLTDAQLRATPVPVSAAQSGAWTVTQAGAWSTGRTWALSSGTDGVTVAGTVAVSGSVAVTGPLTDTQLRASALPVSGTFWQATQPVSGTFWQATQPVSIAAAVTSNQGTAAAVASGWPVKLTDGTSTTAVKAASTAAAATDPSAVVALSPNSPLPAGTSIIGALSANQSVNHAQVAGSTVATSAAGVQKVGVVGNAGAIFDGATASAVPANVLYAGARAATANPTNATGGNLVGVMADKAGRFVTTYGTVRELVGIQQTNVAAATETTIVTAGGAGVFNDLAQLVITTAGAAAQTITIKDGTAGTTRLVLNYPNAALAPASPMVLQFVPPLPQAAANANWTVTQSAATACNYTATFLKNT